MYHMLSMILRNTVSMSFIILTYLLITKIFLRDYVAKWRYYSWLIPAIGLVVPIRPTIRIFLKQESTLQKLPDLSRKISQGVQEKSMTGSASVGTVLCVLWIVGIVCFVCFHIWRHSRFMKLVHRWKEKVTDWKVLRIFEQTKKEMGITKSLELMLCPCVQTPMMIGFFHPMILLPRVDYYDSDLKFLLKHELVHYQRKDLWYKLFIFSVTACYWFHPLVYWMVHEISVQCEISCDEMVLYKERQAARQQYGVLILSIIQGQTIPQSIFTTNFNSGKKQVKERIQCIMNQKKKRKGILAMGCIITMILSTGITFSAVISGSNTMKAASQQVSVHAGTEDKSSDSKETKGIVYYMGNKKISKSQYEKYVILDKETENNVMTTKE